MQAFQGNYMDSRWKFLEFDISGVLDREGGVFKVLAQKEGLCREWN